MVSELLGRSHRDADEAKAGENAATRTLGSEPHRQSTPACHGRWRIQVHGRQDRSSADKNPPRGLNGSPKKTTVTTQIGRDQHRSSGGGAVEDEEQLATRQGQSFGYPSRHHPWVHLTSGSMGGEVVHPRKEVARGGSGQGRATMPGRPEGALARGRGRGGAPCLSRMDLGRGLGEEGPWCAGLEPPRRHHPGALCGFTGRPSGIDDAKGAVAARVPRCYESGRCGGRGVIKIPSSLEPQY